VLFQLRRELFAESLHRTLPQCLKLPLFKFQVRLSLSELLVFDLEHFLDIQELRHDGVIKLEGFLCLLPDEAVRDKVQESLFKADVPCHEIESVQRHFLLVNANLLGNFLSQVVNELIHVDRSLLVFPRCQLLDRRLDQRDLILLDQSRGEIVDADARRGAIIKVPLPEREGLRVRQLV